MNAFEVRIEEADLIAAFRLLGRRSRRQARPFMVAAAALIIILIALLVAFPDARAAFGRSGLLSGLLGAVLIVAGLLALILAATPWLYRRGAGRTLAENPAFEKPIVYTVGESEFTIETGYSKASYPWSRLHGWRQDERIVLILLTPQLYFVVPKTQVASSDLQGLVERLGPETR